MGPKKKVRRTSRRDILFISREYDGLAGAGGVKDVCRQLAETLAENGHRVRVIVPCYGFIKAKNLGFEPLVLPECPKRVTPGASHSFLVDMDYTDEERRESVFIWARKIKGVTIWLVDAERYGEKQGVYTYTAQEQARTRWQKEGEGHLDYFAMNILLQKSALDLLLLLDERPDVIHCHDGHAACLAPIIRENGGYRHYFRHTGLVVTIHNAGIGYHQEVDDLEFAQAVTGLPTRVITAGRLGNSFDPFLAAAPYAELNAVSENYARELQESGEDARTGWLGHRLLQRNVRLAGITNGINPAAFNPARPRKLGIAAAFDPLNGNLAGKKTCKSKLLVNCQLGHLGDQVIRYGLLRKEEQWPLFTFIGRLTPQKGVDLLLQSLKNLLAKDQEFQVLILGSGSREQEDALIALTDVEACQERICFLKGYDPALALKVYAGGDFFLIPSLYEPCGLTDYIAQLLGNLPIVRAVGGLVKVLDGETGFSYKEHSAAALSDTMLRAMHLYRQEPDRLPHMQQNAVRRIHELHTWPQVMDRYLKLYDKAQKRTRCK
jgi:starch synthase